MPTIDIYAEADVFPEGAERILATRLTAAILHAEGFGKKPSAQLQSVVGFYMHRMPLGSVHTLASDRPRTVRVQVTAHPGGLDDEKRRNAFIAEATATVAEVAGDATLAERTWVILVESIQGGWGIAGRVSPREHAAALRAAAAAEDNS